MKVRLIVSPRNAQGQKKSIRHSISFRAVSPTPYRQTVGAGI